MRSLRGQCQVTLVARCQKRVTWYESSPCTNFNRGRSRRLKLSHALNPSFLNCFSVNALLRHGDPKSCFTPLPGLQRNTEVAGPVYSRSSFPYKHPRLVVHNHRPTRHPFRRGPVLRASNLSRKVPLRRTFHHHVYAFGAIHDQFPNMHDIYQHASRGMESCMDCRNHTHGVPELHDRRGTR
jgi:hypothetical protein